MIKNDTKIIKFTSFMRHVLKILLQILYNRIFLKCEAETRHDQFGFRSGMGIREAPFRLLEMSRPTERHLSLFCQLWEGRWPSEASKIDRHPTKLRSTWSKDLNIKQKLLTSIKQQKVE